MITVSDRTAWSILFSAAYPHILETTAGLNNKLSLGKLGRGASSSNPHTQKENIRNKEVKINSCLWPLYENIHRTTTYPTSILHFWLLYCALYLFFTSYGIWAQMIKKTKTRKWQTEKRKLTYLVWPSQPHSCLHLTLKQFLPKDTSWFDGSVESCLLRKGFLARFG